MNGSAIFGVLIHWLHIFGAACAVAGALFQRLVIWPALQKLEGDARDAMDRNVRSRLGKFVIHSSLLAILTGFFNLYRVLGGLGYLTAEQGVFKVPHQFWMVFLVKFICALTFFGLSILLILPTDDWKGFNARRPFYMWMAVLAGAATFLFSAWMRIALERRSSSRSDHSPGRLVDVTGLADVQSVSDRSEDLSLSSKIDLLSLRS